MKIWHLAALLLAATVSAQEQRRLIVQFEEPPLTAQLVTRAAAGAYAGAFGRFRDDLAAIEAAPAATGVSNARVDREFFRTFHGVSVRVTRRESIAAIAKLPYVRAVHPDLEVAGYTLSPQDLVARQSIVTNSRGAGVVVAIIDSGIDYTHPALGGGIGLGRKVIGGYDFVNQDADPMDDHRHGTHVAGIVAANSATISGVAPAASLLAYKVLNAQGRGRQSDVIAAIELAIDPNGDGDFSDRADVANLSLGSRGNPLDPVAQAVENAVSSGMVVVAAAGNDGLFHGVGSPAVAHAAIAVGAVDDASVLAEFSNRGPAPRSGAIKPDVLAPGVAIRSTAIGGGTLVLSGTSMAAPYVSGLAALLVEKNPDWTPAHVKSALVSTATPLAAEEVMSQGAGVVDAGRALASSSWTSPSQLNFGLADLTATTWTTSGTISITNPSRAPRTFAIAVTGAAGAIRITPAVSSLHLAPGEAREVAVALEADIALLGDPASPSFAFGGLVVLQSDEETLRIPWAFLKAARVVVEYDREFPLVALVGRELTRASFAILDPTTVEALLAPGEYDVIVSSSWEDAAQLIIRESQNVAGDVVLQLASTDAKHAITLDARDETGAPFPNVENENALYRTDTRLLLQTPLGLSSLQLDHLKTKILHTSSFSERFGLLFTESYIDGPRRRMYVAQHDVLHGCNAARTLTKTAAEFQSRDVRLRFPSGSTRREVGILARGEVRRPFEIGTAPMGVLTSSSGDEWRGTIIMTPEVHPDYASGMQLFLYSGHESTQGLASMVTPMLRLTNRGFVSTRPFDPPPLPVEVGVNDSYDFRSGTLYPNLVMSAIDQGWHGTLSVIGQRSEARTLERAATTYRVADANGAEVAAGPVGLANPLFIPLPARGAYRARFVTEEKGTLDISVDTRGDGTPPALTSFAVLDAEGHKVSRLPYRGNGSLVFSVADYVVQPEETRYRRIAGMPSVFFRRAHAISWVQLHVQQTGEETEASGRAAIGGVFRVDLAEALQFTGDIELRVEFSDTDGNGVAYTVPAFTVEDTGGRRRSVRR